MHRGLSLHRLIAAGLAIGCAAVAITPVAGAEPVEVSTVPSDVASANSLVPASSVQTSTVLGFDLSALDPLHVYFLPERAGEELILDSRKYLGGDFSRANLNLSLNKRTAVALISSDHARIVGTPLLGLPAATTVSKDAGVWAADLGISWDDGRGRTLMAFGDNYGPGHFGPMSRFRGSAIGYADTTNPRNVRMTRFVTGFENRALEILESNHRQAMELSKIPTAGIAIGSTQYVDMMSVRRWGDPGYWYTNWARVYKSTDYGVTWRPTGIYRPNKDGFSNFQMGAFVRRGAHIYEFGTPNGRMGDAYVSRVRVPDFEKLEKWEYWNGRKWVANNPDAARAVIPGRVSELTVQWNPGLQRFMMLTLGAGDAIYLRYSKDLVRWTNRVKIIPEQRSKVYSPYFLPHQSGRRVYFTLSTWFPYTVSTIEADLPSAAAMDSLPYIHYPEDPRPDFIKMLFL